MTQPDIPKKYLDKKLNEELNRLDKLNTKPDRCFYCGSASNGGGACYNCGN